MFVSTVEIPNRSLFRQPEVCDIAQVQLYVLRTWEAEFPDLGVAKTAGGPRVYRRSDVERVLRLKHLLFVEGLTLAGARKKLATESGEAAPEAPNEFDDLLGTDVRQRLASVKKGLKDLHVMLARQPQNAAAAPESFELHEPPPPPAKKTKTVTTKKRK
ncbi:MAG: MerR family transcriptional regulator [Acidobacteria bacterium]|nr:MerR family transcriptional regulator [Acidobacteriota bacterium]